MVDENSAAGKQALMLRSGFSQGNCSDISTKIFFVSMVLTDLANLNQKITGKTLKYKTVFK
jgi:hypothetical protein